MFREQCLIFHYYNSRSGDCITGVFARRVMRDNRDFSSSARCLYTPLLGQLREKEMTYGRFGIIFRYPAIYLCKLFFILMEQINPTPGNARLNIELQLRR